MQAPATSDQAARFNDRVFTQIMNLDRSPERLATIRAFADAAGLAFTRYPAIEGKLVDTSTPEMRAMIDMKAWVRRHHRNPTPADVGCYLSHFNAIDAFLAQDKAFGLIFEDDAAFGADFITSVAPALDTPDDWDILKLHARHPGPLVVRRNYPNGVTLCSFIARPAGAAAYLINRAAAEKMRKHLKPAVKMIDWQYDQGHLMGLKVRTLDPMPVSLQPVPSTRDMKLGKRSWLEKQTDRPILPRWQLPFRRLWDDIHRTSYNLFGDGGLRAMMFGPDRT